MINPTAWPGRDSQETLPASDSQLESALREASLGMTTPENRIRRTMSQPPEISHEKTDMPQKRRRIVKVIRRKVATPQDGLTVPPTTEAPPQVPPASKEPCQNEAMQLVSPGPTQAEHAQAHAEKVSSPSAPAASAATEAPQPSAAATAGTIPETALETTPEQDAQPAAPEPTTQPEVAAPPASEEVKPPPKVPVKTELATPRVEVKQEQTDETSPIPTKAEPTSARRRQAVEQAKHDNMHRCSTNSQLGSPVGPSIPGAPNASAAEAGQHGNASGPSDPTNGASEPSGRPNGASEPSGPPKGAATPAPAEPPAPEVPPRPTPTPAATKNPDSTDGKSTSNDDDETKSMGGHSSSTSFSHLLERELGEMFDQKEAEAEAEAAARKNRENKAAVDKVQPPIPKRRREKTLEEKAIHAKFMRFTRHIQSFLSRMLSTQKYIINAHAWHVCYSDQNAWMYTV